MPGVSSIPESWLAGPPEILVIGVEPYARALAFVLGAGRIGQERLLGGIPNSPDGGLPQVLGDLQRVVVVAAASHSAADLLRCHEALWRWIEKLSPDGDQHEVSILFVLPPSSGDALAESLAIGLGFEDCTAETGKSQRGWAEFGLGLASMDASLEEFCRRLAAISPCDLPPLRARQAGNVRHNAIRQLIDASCAEDFAKAAEAVTDRFKGQEYHLDLFCRPPSHRNANQLRQWLQEAVSEGVTPKSVDLTKAKLAEWIRPE